ncbi:hypothetical protein [Bacillus sp. MMSF_3328]|uniref:hypothetical protein n=1 Tax=Bacillus sp. MMSF_3328 TaxID=3047080 RepID=UPI00273E4EFD|nr:hypothetical protein [Bacillus sp. MMSF_3328]
MPGGIYLLQDDGELIEMNEQPYNSEDLLQTLVAKYPNLLAGDQMNKENPRRWVLISREMPIASQADSLGRWSVDHLFLDQDGIPTLVEVKRSSDTRIRREVIGQLLEYAANATMYWSIEGIRERFEKHCIDNGMDFEQEIYSLTGDLKYEEYWMAVESNIQTGKIRLVILADDIPTEMKRIVEFLNEQMNPAELLAIEVKQFIGNNLKSLVPRLIGQTSEAVQKKRTGTRGTPWDEDLFFEELQRTSPEDVNITKEILEWSKQNMSYIWWGAGKVEGSFVPTIIVNDIKFHLFSVRTSGQIELYFKHLTSRPVFENEAKRLELLTKMNGILDSTQQIPDDSITRLPKISISALNDPSKLLGFFDTYKWFIDEVRTSD